MGLEWLLLAGLGLAPEREADLQLVWRAPAQCPSEAEVRAQLVAQLEALPVDRRRAASAEAVVEASLTHDGEQYELRLDISTADGDVRRRLVSHDCELLAKTTGLVVGLALDAAVAPAAIANAAAKASDPLIGAPPTAGRDDPTRAPPADAATAPSLRYAEPDRAARARTRAAGVDADAVVRLSGGPDVGILPGVGGVLDLSVAAAAPWWRAEMHGSRWFVRRASFEGEPEVGAAFSMWSGGLRGCVVPSTGAIEFPLCGGVEVGQVRAKGFGAPTTFTTRAVWAGVAVAPGVMWLPRPWLGLYVGVDGFVALRRPGHTGAGRASLYRAAPAAVRALVGVEIRGRRKKS